MNSEKVIVQEDEIDLYELFQKIKKRKKLIVKIFLASTLLSVIISLLLTKYYKSEAVIMPVTAPSSGSFSQLAAIASMSINYQDPTIKIDAVLNSDTIAEMVVKELNLVEVIFEGDPPSNQDPVQAAVRSLKKNIIDVKMNKKNGTITISSIWKNPIMAKNITEKYIEKLKLILSEKALTISKANRVFLEEELNKLRKKIDTQKNVLAKFQKKEKVIEPTEQMKGSMALYANLISRKMALEVEVRQLESILSPDSPQVQNKKELLESIKKEIKKLENTKESAVLGLTDAPYALKNYSDILMDLKISEEIYKNLYALYEKARLDELKDDIFIEVIDYPKIPDIKFKPKRALIVAVSAISSIFFAIFLVFFLDYYENIKKGN